MAQRPTHRFRTALSAVLMTAALAACGQRGDTAAAPTVVLPTVAPEGFEEGKLSLEGRITLKGTPRTSDAVLDTSSDPYCRSHGPVRSEKWTISADGGLANAVITVVDAPLTPAGAAPAPIVQEGCRYQPPVSAFGLGHSVEVRNGDATFHNVRVVRHEQGSTDRGQNVANYMQPQKGDATTHHFAQAGPHRLECDVHRWMRSWVYVAPNNHVALSQPGGTFQITRGLRDGTYTVQAWHSQFPEPITKSVQVVEGHARVDFEFDASLALN